MGASVIFGVLCVIMPVVAWAVINLEWQFNVPLINITYKPWRLFLVICSLPGLFAFFILMFLPESPKFVLGQGNQMETHKILQKMHRMNNGTDSTLELFEIYEEPESIEHRQLILESQASRFPLLASVWQQTVPLFKGKLLRPTLLICIVQFTVFYTCEGFNIFYTDIINKMAGVIDDLVYQRVMMCDIIHMKVNETSSEVSS